MYDRLMLAETNIARRSLFLQDLNLAAKPGTEPGRHVRKPCKLPRLQAIHARQVGYGRRVDIRVNRRHQIRQVLMQGCLGVTYPSDLDQTVHQHRQGAGLDGLTARTSVQPGHAHRRITAEVLA